MLQPVPLLSLVILLAPSAVSAAFDCSFDIAPNHHFNLLPLRGLHTAFHTIETPPTLENTTIFLDLCQDLEWNNDVYKPADRCEDGTQGSRPQSRNQPSRATRCHKRRSFNLFVMHILTLWVVCAIKYTQRGDVRTISQIIPVAGTFPSHPLESKTSLLTGTTETEVNGVRLELHGPVYQDQRQSAIIDLTCDKSVDVRTPSILSLMRPFVDIYVCRLERFIFDRLMRGFYDLIGERIMPVQQSRKTRLKKMSRIVRSVRKRNIGVFSLG